MRSREEFQEFLRLATGVGFIYAQAPTSDKMSYPCIKYELSDIPSTKANNKLYITHSRYMLTYIGYDLDDPMIGTLTNLPNCRFDRHYADNGLHHWVFSIYY